MKKRLIILLYIISLVQICNAQYREYKTQYDRKDYVRDPFYDLYNPPLIGVASYFIPGLGQAICGEYGRAAGFFFGTYAVYGATVGGFAFFENKYMETGHPKAQQDAFIVLGVGVAATITLWVVNVVDATRVAKVMNMANQDRRNLSSLNLSISPTVINYSDNFSNNSTAGLALRVSF